MAQIAPKADSGIGDIVSLLNLFKPSGGSTTTVGGGASTTEETVSQDHINALVAQMLGGTQGLAAVAQGEKTAGIYNSTTGTQLTNDLLSRTAAVGASLNKTTTTTTAPKTQVTTPSAQLGMSTLVGLLGTGVVSSLLGPSAKAASGKLGITSAGDKLKDLLGLGDEAAAGGGDAGAGFGASGADLSTGIGGESFNASSALGSSAPDISTALSFGESSIDGMATSVAGSAAADSLGAEVGSGVGDSVGGAAGGGLAAEGIAEAAGAETAGTVGEGVLSAGFGEAGASLAGDALAGEAGVAIGEGIIGGAAEAGGFEEAVGLALAAWIVCTELNKQGRLPWKFYVYGAREFAKYKEEDKKGYYIWAVPAVKHLRKYPTSKFSKLLEVVFNARAEYLSSVGGLRGARKTVLGYITTHGLYWICIAIARTIARNYDVKSELSVINSAGA